MSEGNFILLTAYLSFGGFIAMGARLVKRWKRLSAARKSLGCATAVALLGWTLLVEWVIRITLE